jgi:amino acid transporter
MYYFIVLVALDIVFEILNYFWSSIGDIFKKNSPWSDCPKDLEFWHSVHSIVALVILCLILLIFGRFRNRFIPPLFLMRFATVLQLFSLYWLVLGWVWIEEVLTKDKSCVMVI